MEETRLVAACFDVHYWSTQARACCVVFEVRPREHLLSFICTTLEHVSPYVPGEFYKRELPCILQAYEEMDRDADLVIVDGFVTLGEGKKGLGAHLFHALGETLPVIGVAKTFFEGAQDCAPVFRGRSQKPLYVSSIGVGLDFAANLIKNLDGPHRIPDVLRGVDLLTRNGPGSHNASPPQA